MSRINKVRGRKAVDIEAVALSLIEKFQPGILNLVSAFDAEAFFDTELQSDTGIEAVYEDLPEGVEGITDFGCSKCYVSTRLLDQNGGQVLRRRLRSTIAHEIGHCYLHFKDFKRNRDFQKRFENDGAYPPENYRPEQIDIYEDSEWQAWRFASALLMPEKMFRLAIERGWTKTKLKHGFDVNPSFVDVRIRELRIPALVPKGC